MFSWVKWRRMFWKSRLFNNREWVHDWQHHAGLKASKGRDLHLSPGKSEKKITTTASTTITTRPHRPHPTWRTWVAGNRALAAEVCQTVVGGPWHAFPDVCVEELRVRTFTLVLPEGTPRADLAAVVEHGARARMKESQGCEFRTECYSCFCNSKIKTEVCWHVGY